MTMALIIINKRLVFDFSEMNLKSFWLIIARMGSRYHRLHLVGKIFTLDITEISTKDLRP